MKRLHEVTGEIRAWVWGYVYGANGRAITPVPDNTYQPYFHLYEIERGAPSLPIGTNDRYGISQRRYWQPWGNSPNTVDRRLNPLCGRLRTASRNPRFSFAGDYGHTTYNCPDCTRIARARLINPRFQRDIIAHDPWNAISYDARMTTPDPITGR